MTDAFALASAPRWTGAPGRLEVWYATLTDLATGTGLWIHHEIVAPSPRASRLALHFRGSHDDDDAQGQPPPPYGHGWICLFPSIAPPRTARFGPQPIKPYVNGGAWFEAAGCRAMPGRLTGSADGITWDLSWKDRSVPLWTFPQTLWSRELLPAAQVVPAPTASFTGTVDTGATTYSFEGARGAVAHIYGHGNAARWGWVHADLGGGEVLELVTAVSRKRLMNRLPPLAFVRLRFDGRDQPEGLLPAWRATTRLGLPEWSVTGRLGKRRLRVLVHQPASRCVALEYIDPDGAVSVCTNTERADVLVELERPAGGRWTVERSWQLDGTGHAEVGLRGADAPPIKERTRR